MEPKDSVPDSQVLATSPCPEPDQSSHCPPFHFLKIRDIITHPSTPGSSRLSQVSRSITCIRFSSPHIRATCAVHLILFYLVTRTMFGEQYRSLSSSICSLLHSPVTSSHLVPNILLNTLFWNALKLPLLDLQLDAQNSHLFTYNTFIKILYMFRALP
jgi:hypothetical protein